LRKGERERGVGERKGEVKKIEGAGRAGRG